MSVFRKADLEAALRAPSASNNCEELSIWMAWQYNIQVRCPGQEALFGGEGDTRMDCCDPDI
jgi:hypothetical protein